MNIENALYKFIIIIIIIKIESKLLGLIKTLCVALRCVAWRGVAWRGVALRWMDAKLCVFFFPKTLDETIS